MIKRIVFIVISLILVFSFTFASASTEFLFGPRFRFESNLNHVFIDETYSGHHFKYLQNYMSDIKDQVGYFPDYEIDYDNQTVTIWLFNSIVEVKCLVIDEDDLDNRKVIIPAVGLEESLIEYNELYSTLINRAYKLNELESQSYVIESVDVEDDGELKVMINRVEVFAREYTIYEGEYFLSPNEFRQLWFQVYRHQL